MEGARRVWVVAVAVSAAAAVVTASGCGSAEDSQASSVVTRVTQADDEALAKAAAAYLEIMERRESAMSPLGGRLAAALNAGDQEAFARLLREAAAWNRQTRLDLRQQAWPASVADEAEAFYLAAVHNERAYEDFATAIESGDPAAIEGANEALSATGLEAVDAITELRAALGLPPVDLEESIP